MLTLLLFVACQPSDPKVPADCESAMGESARNECYAKVAPAEFKTNPDAGIKLVEEKITDQTVRDFVYLQVTREVDLSTPKYCERIQDDVLEERCRVLVSRPHLQRAGTPGQGLSPSGGPPPGGAPPGGAPPAGTTAAGAAPAGAAASP